MPILNGNAPIRVSQNPKHCKRLNNVFPDDHNNYDHVLHDVDSGPILRKLWHPKPDLSAPMDPLYYLPFIPEKHKAIMKHDMDLSHLEPGLQERIYNIARLATTE